MYRPLHIITYYNRDRWVTSFCGIKLDIEFDNFIMLNDVDNSTITQDNINVCVNCVNKLNEYIGKDNNYV